MPTHSVQPIGQRHPITKAPTPWRYVAGRAYYGGVPSETEAALPIDSVAFARRFDDDLRALAVIEYTQSGSEVSIMLLVGGDATGAPNEALALTRPSCPGDWAECPVPEEFVPLVRRAFEGPGPD